jgi:hypothetical protein
VAIIERTFEIEVRYAALTWTTGGEVRVSDLEVRPQSAPAGEDPLFRAREVVAHADLDLEAGQVGIRDTTVRGATVALVRRADGSDNLRGLVERARRLLGGGGGGEAGPGGGGRLSKYLKKELPRVSIEELDVAIDAGPLDLPSVVRIPTRVTLSQGRVAFENPALLAEEGRLELDLRFADTSVDPGYGLALKASVPFDGKGITGSVVFDRQARIQVGRRVVAARGLSWDGRVLAIDDVAVSVPITGQEASVDPAVTVAKVVLVPGPELNRETLAEAAREKSRMAAASLVLAGFERIELQRPGLVFEGADASRLRAMMRDTAGAKPVEGPSEKPPLEPAEPPDPEAPLADLMLASVAAHDRLTGKEADTADGEAVRSFLTTQATGLEARFDAAMERVLGLARRAPVKLLVIREGHFAWRNDLDATREGVAERMENFDLEVRQEDQVLSFSGAFSMPGSGKATNVFDGRLQLVSGDIQLHAKLGRLRLFPYRQIAPRALRVEEKTLLEDTDLTLTWSPASGIGRVEGKLNLRGASFESRRVSSLPLVDLDMGLDFALSLDRKRKIIELAQSRVRLGKVWWTLKGGLHRYDALPRVWGVIALERSRAQDLVDSIPVGMRPMLEGLELEGTVGWHLDFDLNLARIDDLQYEWRPEAHQFRVVRLGDRIDLATVLGTFRHRFIQADGTEREILVGPESPGWVPLEEISPYMVQAVTTTEDGSFFRHEGFSPYAIRQSFITNLKKGGFFRGASTISQQLTKNLFLSGEKTISRKLQEIFLTWQLESVVPKDRIMALYLNVIEWGPGIYGIRQAAEHYYGKHPRDLNPLEVVFLASIIPDPRGRHGQFERGYVTDGWRRKLRWIMGVMVERKKLSQEEFEAAAPYSPLFRGQVPPSAPLPDL